MQNIKYDVVVVGAGAAGLMAAATSAKRGRKTLLLESTNKIGEKIRISGGGRCNFTNINACSDNYISQNSHFVKSALARYNQYDFIKLVQEYKIAYHEKTLGQLFCDGSSSQIIDMLLNECKKYGVDIFLNAAITSVFKSDYFHILSNTANFIGQSLIIATGGLSIPKIGASDFGYRIAKQFDLNVVNLKPALVPLTVFDEDLEFFKNLSGISIDSIASFEGVSFRENILFTHRGLSGPAILQISSYLDERYNKDINLNLIPNLDIKKILLENKNSKTLLNNFLKEYLPKRFIDNYFEPKRLVDFSSKDLEKVSDKLSEFKVKIKGSEGYLKAEVTSGGVDTKNLSSKTMESKNVSGLFFIGEVVDVTGWLGGYNFQWAWSSGVAAGSHA